MPPGCGEDQSGVLSGGRSGGAVLSLFSIELSRLGALIFFALAFLPPKLYGMTADQH